MSQRALQIFVIFEVAVSALTATRIFRGIEIIKGGRRLAGWELYLEIFEGEHIIRTLVALSFMIGIMWAIHKGKRWALPFVLILLTDAALYLAWICLPWAWVYQDTLWKITHVCEGVVLITCFIILFSMKGGWALRKRDLANVGIAIFASLAIIYVKGHYSFCCPQYGPEPPMWWVYFDISNLWDRPRETGLLIMWGCYAGVLGFLWGRGKVVRLSDTYTSPDS